VKSYLALGLAAVISVACGGGATKKNDDSSGGQDGAGATGGSVTAGGSATGGAGGSGTGGSDSAGGSTGTAGGTGGSGGGVDVPDTPIKLGAGVLHIWPVGDSITMVVDGSYRVVLYNMLAADGYAVDLVGTQFDGAGDLVDHEHEGHSGYNAAKLVLGDCDGCTGDIPTWLASGIPTPDVVTLMIGTNDVAWGEWQTVETTVTQLMQVVDLLRTLLPEAAVLVGSIPPEESAVIPPNSNDRSPIVVAYNDAMEAAVLAHADYSTKVFFVDCEQAVTVADLYDGVHPSRAGHDKIAVTWYDVMKPLLPPPP
jgi:lysophospholipase L1-like esterase